ncbi:MFS general substrate transporter [Hypoxylon trugodes]|uniref:MFS general substrate transporter n=1 Tax=Hypoxylon trugodes TaxID=326681 RepID=UPI002193D307|nr:MFS general substrate transporter [Hypoxylon trugodes]KAI1394362.1 MFS general substrate transporter [Hypoxylon trugodes]
MEELDQKPPEKSQEEQAIGDLEQAETKEDEDGGQQRVTHADEEPSMIRILLVSISLWFAVFLVSLDQTIVANAIPSISDDFQKLSDVGWYGSGYLLTTAAFQLFYGRVYANFSIKYTFLAAIGLFELGSLICGVAPTSTALIIGRAIAGVGGAGITSGSMIIITHIVPLRIRPIFVASLGIIFAVASILGPILGGVFSTKVTWRWCFYINLPFGGATILAVLLLFKSPKRPQLDSISLKEKLNRIDFIGLLLFIPSIVCLLLALQWAGSTYAWNDGRIIALFVVFGMVGIIFLAFEFWKGAEATLPLRMLARRSVAAATWNCFCNGATFLTFVYYIPFWHQVIGNVTAADSGIRLLPFVLGVVIMAMISGALVSKLGYYAPMMILSSIIAPIGAGLMTTWTVDTSFSKWVGYQALLGIGIGLGQQQPFMAIQTVLSKQDVSSGISIVLLTQTISAAIFISVGQSVLQNELLKNLTATLPNADFDVSSLVDIGATQLWSATPPKYLNAVLIAYNGALTKVFTIGVCTSALTILGSLAVEWKSVKKGKDTEQELGTTTE